jgi:hypothetical protein
MHGSRGVAGLIAAATLSLAHAATAETYHVAPGGDDGQDGSAAAPWRTLQRAADQVGPGDTVMVAAGDYAGMYLEASGTEAQPLRFLAEDGVVVTGDNDVTPDGLNLEGSEWVTIEGFTVTGATRAGIRTVLGAHVTLRGNRLDQNGRWGCHHRLLRRPAHRGQRGLALGRRARHLRRATAAIARWCAATSCGATRPPACT